MEVKTRKTKEQRKTSTPGMGKTSRFKNKIATAEAEARQEMWNRMNVLRRLA